MTTKEEVLDIIRRMPEEATVADIIAELCFRQKVDQGLRELDVGKGVPHEEARKRLDKWLA